MKQLPRWMSLSAVHRRSLHTGRGTLAPAFRVLKLILEFIIPQPDALIRRLLPVGFSPVVRCFQDDPSRILDVVHHVLLRLPRIHPLPRRPVSEASIVRKGK